LALLDPLASMSWLRPLNVAANVAVAQPTDATTVTTTQLTGGD
jgi:hypothetical protein